MKRPAPVLLLLAFASPVLAQTPVLLPEFQINARDQPNFRQADDLTMGEDGRFVVAWTEFGQDSNLFGRRFDDRAALLGPTFPINSPSPAGRDYWSSIARDAEGRFVAVWSHQDGSVWGRRFSSDGTPLGDSFKINGAVSASGRAYVASDAAGNFIVTWGSALAGGDALARSYDSAGASLGNEFTVNAFTTGLQTVKGVAASPAGFVITWSGPGAVGLGLFGRRFDASGTPMGGDFEVSSGATPASVGDVSMSATGQSVFVWTGQDGDSVRVFGRQFATAGAPLGPAFAISAATGTSHYPRVASDAAGNFLVAWFSGFADSLDGDSSAIAARLYSIDGLPVAPEFLVNEFTPGEQYEGLPGIAGDGTFVVAWSSRAGEYSTVDLKARKSGLRASRTIEMDPDVGLASRSEAAAGNGVFEPGETQVVRTSWTNETAGAVSLSGTAPSFTGPLGANYVLEDGAASYGTIAAGQSASCADGGDCYAVQVSAPASRPVQHWDALLHEVLSSGLPKSWVLHIGESFPDVATDHPFYDSIETLLHTRVTSGCAGGGYCPDEPVSRAQMAVFLLKAKLGAAHIPPPCTGTVFTDVPCTGGPFDPWIEELAGLAITGGCGGTKYCPGSTVTRQQMAVFVVKALEGSAYDPPDCVGIFDDVPCTPGSGFSDWIEEFANRGITGGCSVTPPLYCPTNPNNRGQMAVFLVKTFGLVLYGG